MDWCGGGNHRGVSWASNASCNRPALVKGCYAAADLRQTINQAASFNKNNGLAWGGFWPIPPLGTIGLFAALRGSSDGSNFPARLKCGALAVLRLCFGARQDREARRPGRSRTSMASCADRRHQFRLSHWFYSHAVDDPARHPARHCQLRPMLAIFARVRGCSVRE